MHGWAIEEFLKSQLKNRRAYARKHGFLQDIANSGIQASDDDMDIQSENAEEEEEEEEVDADASGSQQQEELEENISGSDVSED